MGGVWVDGAVSGVGGVGKRVGLPDWLVNSLPAQGHRVDVTTGLAYREVELPGSGIAVGVTYRRCVDASRRMRRICPKPT
jgi:hypothetical protein